jgi:hypothetical protein
MNLRSEYLTDYRSIYSRIIIQKNNSLRSKWSNTFVLLGLILAGLSGIAFDAFEGRNSWHIFGICGGLQVLLLVISTNIDGITFYSRRRFIKNTLMNQVSCFYQELESTLPVISLNKVNFVRIGENQYIEDVKAQYQTQKSSQHKDLNAANDLKLEAEFVVDSLQRNAVKLRNNKFTFKDIQLFYKINKIMIIQTNFTDYMLEIADNLGSPLWRDHIAFMYKEGLTKRKTRRNVRMNLKKLVDYVMHGFWNNKQNGICIRMNERLSYLCQCWDKKNKTCDFNQIFFYRFILFAIYELEYYGSAYAMKFIETISEELHQLEVIFPWRPSESQTMKTTTTMGIDTIPANEQLEIKEPEIPDEIRNSNEIEIVNGKLRTSDNISFDDGNVHLVKGWGKTSSNCFITVKKKDKSSSDTLLLRFYPDLDGRKRCILPDGVEHKIGSTNYENFVFMLKHCNSMVVRNVINMHDQAYFYDRLGKTAEKDLQRTSSIIPPNNVSWLLTKSSTQATIDSSNLNMHIHSTS